MTSSSVTIVAVGYEVERLFEGQERVIALPDQPARADLQAMTETVADALGRKEAVLAVYPAWQTEPAAQRLETVRACLDTDRVALLSCELPPLAGGVALALLAALAPHLSSPGQVVVALPVVESSLVVVSWLNSVAGLKRPSPSLLQHLQSAGPGSAFAAGLQPEPFVRRISRRGGDLPVNAVGEPMELLVSPNGGDLEWVADVLNPALGSLSLREVAPTRAGIGWWGARQLVETVAHPLDMAPLRERVLEAGPMRLCPWCGVAIAQPTCPFCRHRSAPLLDAPALEGRSRRRLRGRS